MEKKDPRDRVMEAFRESMNEFVEENERARKMLGVITILNIFILVGMLIYHLM